MTSWLQKRRSFLGIAATVVVVGILLFGIDVAFAQDIATNLADVNEAAGLGEADIRVVIGNIIRVILGLLGIVAVLLVIYGGYLWMMSRGDKAKIQKAQQILLQAAIGLIIILSALAITQFVLNSLLDATGAGSSSSDSAPEIIDPFSSALGAGIIDSHYPARNASNVPRNTNIAVTFREPINAATIMDGFDGDTSVSWPLLDGAVSIYPTNTEVELESSDVNVTVTPDLKTFMFDPVPYLGSASENTRYVVELDNNIELATGDDAFTGAFSSGYFWRFTVSTELDLTPPRVTNVVPFASSTNPRNILVQIYYSEAMNPIVTSGAYPAVEPAIDFTNITAVGESGDTVEGEWNLTSQFRVSEFIPSQPCGTNSCGETIYCLPGGEEIDVTALAAGVGEEPPAALLPPNGLTDMAGNSLDGDGDGDATGPITDSYAWSFTTTNDVYLFPPEVVSTLPEITPGNPAENVEFDQPVAVIFDSIMSVSSINADNVLLHSPSEALWFTFGADLVDIADPEEPAVTIPVTQMNVSHGILSDMHIYGVEIDSSLRSVLQNCFTPSRSLNCTGDEANCCNDQSQNTECSYPHFTLPSS